MKNLEIECISGHWPPDENYFPIYYKVGIDGVTKICKVPDCANSPYLTYSFQIWKGENLFSCVTWAAVAEIFFTQETENEI